MKRLLMLMILAMFATSATGCGWWRPWHRGAPCGDPCGGMTSAYNAGSFDSGYEVAYPPGVSTPSNITPGPVRVLPPPS